VRRFGKVRWLAVVSAAALTTGIAVPVLASTGQPGTEQASVPGWRVTRLLPGIGSATIVASSTTDAWLAGGSTILHWTGGTWQSVPAPASIKKAVATPVLALAPGQPSAAWAFDYTQNPDNGVNRAFAVRWTGKGWSSPTLFAQGTVIQTAVAPARNDVWAFGGDYAVRYNGTKWSTAPSTGIGVWSASALSGSDIWVVGSPPGTVKGNFRIVVKHWDGKKWTAARLPAVAVPAAPAVETAWPVQVTAISDKDVWVTGTVSYPGEVGPDALLLHWNGKAWSQTTIPYQVGDPIIMAPDGKGGIWLSGTLYPGQEPYFFHDAGGHWTSVPIPAVPHTTAGDFSGMAAIPGTTSVWGAGSVISGTPPSIHGKNAILKYGN
jgi:hypothetical protein